MVRPSGCRRRIHLPHEFSRALLPAKQTHKISIDENKAILIKEGRNLTKTMKKRYFLGLIIIGASIIGARADIIPTLSSTTPSGSNFSWNYSANVTVDETINTGDYFTIYDFGPIIGTATSPTGWTFSQSLLGPTPALVTPNDNPNKLNLTWTYTGTTAINGAFPLGTFSVVTNTNQLQVGQFAAEATRSTNPNAGTKIDNIGTVSVPVPEMSALLPILSVCGAGLLSLLPSLLRKRQTS
jgi:hypothetical protein